MMEYPTLNSLLPSHSWAPTFPEFWDTSHPRHSGIQVSKKFCGFSNFSGRNFSSFSKLHPGVQTAAFQGFTAGLWEWLSQKIRWKERINTSEELTASRGKSELEEGTPTLEFGREEGISVYPALVLVMERFLWDQWSFLGIPRREFLYPWGCSCFPVHCSS